MLRCTQCGSDNRDSARFCKKCGGRLYRVGLPTSGELFHGRYLVTRVVGHGGMGSIYQAKDIRAGDQLVAIKTLPNGSAEVERQFVYEAELLAHLNHPSLPRVIESFSEPSGEQYIVLGWIEGEDLQTLLCQEGSLSEKQVVPWINQVCDAVDYLHHQQPPIFHRGITPSNIIITPNKRAMLVGFGSAEHSSPKRDRDTVATPVTPPFSPPEQYRRAEPDALLDVYSLAATTYYLLTNQTPPDALQRLLGTEALISPRQINPAISTVVESAILRAMALNPANRTQSIREFRETLIGSPTARLQMPPCPSPAPPSVEVRDQSAPRLINRFPDVTFSERVAINERSVLRVAVTQKPVSMEMAQQVMGIRVPAKAREIAIDVVVIAVGFDIVGAEGRSLVVPLDRDSDPILFTLIPRVLGAKKIKIEFFQEGRYIGGVTATTTVVQPTLAFNAKPASALGIVGLQTVVSPPDLTILITESRPSSDHMQYSFRLHSPANGLFYYPLREPLIFSGAPSRWIEGLYRELGTLGAKASPSDVAETLATIGTGLYESLFPRELKEIWSRRLRGRVRSIQIISDEPWIPWEIIRPSCESETGDMTEDGFLCEDYVLTRWIAGPPPPSTIRISHGAIIAPVTANLPNVKREVAFVKSMLGDVEEIEPSLAIMRGLLKSGGFQLLHFACHGSFDPADYEQPSIHLLGSDRLRPRDIAGERRNFGKDTPFVFVNACNTARGDFSLVGIGSWAGKFVSANSSGFLGASWEVDDTLAYKFCTAFYGALLEDKPIGEAMREARIVIKGAGDPTWLAYTLYADPLAQVIFG